MKTEDITQDWSRKVASYVLIFVGIFMALVSLAMPLFNIHVRDFWFNPSNLYYLLPIPSFTIIIFLSLWYSLKKLHQEYHPFLLSIGVFSMGYLGLGLSLYPWIVPFQYTLHDAAASNPSLSLMLLGVIPLLPLILAYTAYCYYIFRGKTSHEQHY